MLKSPFTPPGDPLLTSLSLEVPVSEILSEKTQGIIDLLFEVAKGERDDTGEKRVMVGLAAPQIGIGKRIILVDIGVDSDRKELGQLTAYINPEIIWSSSDLVEGREGCYSVDREVVGMVPRAEEIQIRAFDREGSLITAKYSGFTARIFQHEIDHLDGIRFPDRVGFEGKLHWVEDEEYAEYRKNSENWSRRCPWDLWISMKEGRPYSAPTHYTD